MLFALAALLALWSSKVGLATVSMLNVLAMRSDLPLRSVRNRNEGPVLALTIPRGG